MTEYAIWKPEHDGHAPPNWRDGMDWAIDRTPREQPREPRWMAGMSYWLPPEALNSPNYDASGDAIDGFYTKAGTADDVAVEVVRQHIDDLEPDYRLTGRKADEPLPFALSILRQYPSEELAKHGITLSDPKDWATELWHEAYDAFDVEDTYSEGHRQAIEALRQALIRERVVLKEGV